MLGWCRTTLASLDERVFAVFEERRADTRLSIMLDADFVVGERCYRGVMLNISAGGAMMATPARPREGDRGVLTMAGRVAKADVMWVTGYRFGLRFDPRLDRAWVDMIGALAANPSRAR